MVLQISDIYQHIHAHWGHTYMISVNWTCKHDKPTGISFWFPKLHYNDVIMTTMASQITSLTVVYSTVYSDADQRKHQSSASLAFVWGIHRDRWIPRGRRNGRPIVRKAILALSDEWLSLATRPMDEQIIIAQMSFIHLGQVDIWFRTSVDAMLLVRRTSASQISRQPLIPRTKGQLRGKCFHLMTSSMFQDAFNVVLYWYWIWAHTLFKIFMHVRDIISAKWAR